MQELFWFFLGAFVYFILDKFTTTLKKLKYIDDIKICSFKLIGFAYEQLVFTTAAKYIALEQSDMDKEKIKLYKNVDEQAFEEWKKETVIGLKEAVPPIYRGVVELDNWDHLMSVLDTHYKKALKPQHKEKPNA